MKIIEKTPAVVTYICEKCNTEYTTETEAKECEKFHTYPVGVLSKEFLNETSKYPDSLDVRMSDASKQTYMRSFNKLKDVTHNVTNDNGVSNLALVDNYSVVVQKEYRDNENLITEHLCGVSTELKDGKLYVNIPDEIEVLSSDSICVKVLDKNENEIVAGSENSPFSEIIIVAEVKQTISNECIEDESNIPFE